MTLLIFGLKVSLIGMGVVYFALILLVYIIKGFSILSALYDKRTKPATVNAAKTPAAPVLLVRGLDRESEEEIAAVISAAVAAYSRDRK